MTLTWIILLPFLGSLCAALLPRNAWNAEAWLAVAVSLGSLTLVGFLYPRSSTARSPAPTSHGCRSSGLG